MARRIVLHIGPRKTATSYIQRVLQHFVESGVLSESVYPVRTRGRLDHNQLPGLVDLVRPIEAITSRPNAWSRLDGNAARALLDAVAATDDDVILSAEGIASLTHSGAQAVITALAPTPVDVIITARDLGQVLPSSWQQHMRNGNRQSYTTYLDRRFEQRRSGSDDREPQVGFWRSNRYGELARRWTAVARHVTVVTVPASSADPGEIWHRFRRAANITALPEVPPVLSDRTANIALTGAEGYVLQGLNRVLRGRGVHRRAVRRWHRMLIRRGWTEREGRGRRLGLPESMIAEVQHWAEDDIADLVSLGVDLVGTIDDLRVSPVSTGLPDAATVAEAAGAALALLARANPDTDRHRERR